MFYYGKVMGEFSPSVYTVKVLLWNVIPCRFTRWTENRKGAGTNSGESGARNLQAETESIRSRAESMGGCEKLKTVTEIRWCSARDTFIAECLSCFFVGLGARVENQSML